MARPSCDIFADLLDLHALKYHGDINWNMSVGWCVSVFTSCTSLGICWDMLGRI